MGIADRREREKLQRRNTIVDAAEKIFFSKGISNTTMDEIAEEAELSKATIYLYFKSKEELYCAIIQRAMDILKNYFKEAIDLNACGLERLYHIAQKLYQFYKDYPNYFESMFHREKNPEYFSYENPMIKDLMEQGEEMYMMGVQIIKDGIEDGSIRSDVDPYKTALALDGMLGGFIRTISLEEDHLMKYHNISAAELIHYSMELIGHALKNKDGCPGKKCNPDKINAKNKGGKCKNRKEK